MHYVSLIVEFLRGRPAVVFWTAALTQAALWVIVPSLFYSTPPGELPMVLAIGHEFRLGSYMGPPLAFWFAEIAFRIAGIFGVYVLAQACVVAAFWSVFELGRAIVGTRHAVLAVLLMVGIAAFNVPTPEFGPAILAMPLWGLALLHYWRAVGEGKRGYWFLLGVDLGLLLLTSYLGVLLFALLVWFSIATPRAWRAFKNIEPWLALVLLAIVIFPHAVWLKDSWPLVTTAFEEVNARAPTVPALWIAAVIVLSHAGVGLLVVLASGWRLRRRERAPEIERHPVDLLARVYVYFIALAPIAVAFTIVAFTGRLGPIERVAPLILATALAVIVAAGDQVRLFRERLVSSAWLGLLTVPPALTVVAIVALPWMFAYDIQVGQPAGDMGQFFADNFQRRTGRPLRYVAGDQRLASLVALTAPGRPSRYLERAPERSPWANVALMRQNGGILLWPATDTAGAPPAALRAQFPDLVPELPRAFARPVQGILPLQRIGWAMVRPQGTTGQGSSAR